MKLTEKTQLITDNEAEQIIMMALAAKPQSQEDLDMVLKECADMRFSALALEGILEGKLSMYVESGELMFTRQNSDV